MTTNPKATLTAADEAALLARGATIYFDRASIHVAWVHPTANGNLATGGLPKERRFVMQGPSGRHSLLVDATDLDRLNAHWTVFVTDPRNARDAA